MSESHISHTHPDQEITILLNEYNLCCTRIEDFIKRQDSILQISLVIMGGVIAFTMLNIIPQELFIAVPLVPFIILIHVLYHFSRVITNQGYRKYLEEILNAKILNNSPIKYYKVGKEFMLEKNPSSKINSIIFPLIFLLSILYSIFMSNFNLIVIGGSIVYIIIIIIVGININSFLKDLDERVFQFCKDNT